MYKYLIFTILISSFLIASKIKTKKVSVFKNGTAYFLKSGEVSVKNKKITINEVGKALFGTLQVSSKNGKILSINNSNKNITEKKDVVNVFDILKANKNKYVIITLNNNKEITAKIINIKGIAVVLKTNTGDWITLTSSEIKNVNFKGEKPKLKYNSKTDRRKIILKFKKDGKKQIELSYLQKGIGWLPTYFIKILNEKKAQITLKAVLINDAENIKNSDIEFIVGVPNFKYSNVYSPLTSKETINNFLDSLSGNSYNNYSNFDNSNAQITTQSLGNSYRSHRSYNQSNLNYNPNSYSGLNARSYEDLYFYNIKNISLKKGERGSYQLFTAVMPMEHIYELNLPTNATTSGYYTYKYNRLITQVNKVWHSLKLTNKTKYPWTTGTAMVVKKEKSGDKPISQDMIKYTPVTGNSFLKITVSTDIHVTDADKEISRKRSALKRNSYKYDLVTVKAEIIIKNYKKTPIKLEIKRSVLGKLLKTSSKWNTYKKLKGVYSSSVNPINEVSWDITLKPNEEKKIEYSYSVYMSN